jgi:tetratricopeptide (TPR) repeat protein
VKATFLTLFFLIWSFAAIAQDQVFIDSLQVLVKTATSDTSQINYLLEISRYHSKYDFVEAAKYAQRALDLSIEKGLERSQAKAERTLGGVFFEMGDYRSASIQYFRTLKYHERIKDSVGIVIMNVNLGAVHDRLREYDKALEYYLKAQSLLNLVTIDNATRVRYLTTIYNNIANIYQTKKNFQSARQYYEKSLQLSRESDNKKLEGIALNNLGKLYTHDLKEPGKASVYLAEGLKVRKELGDKGEMAKSYIQLSDYLQSQKNYREAENAARQALQLGQEVGSLELQKEGYHSLSNAREATGKFRESLLAYREFKRLSDSIQSQLASREIAKLQLQYDFEKTEQARILERDQIQTRFTIAIIALSSGLLIAVLLVIVVRSRARQMKLKQKNLTQDVEIKNKELTTNVMYLIRKNELINEVAERLLQIKQNILPENQKAIHDIILALQREADSDTWKEFTMRFNQVHSEFYDKLRKSHSGLSPTDEKLCAFLRLNMSSKEIAAITKQSVKSIEVARARLRKKLNLTNTSSNLVTYLTNL